ncbi:MAG TPA: cytochrome c [Thermoanaerobaculia bacterium]
MKTVVVTLLGGLIFLLLAGLLFIFSGVYDVAATGEDGGPIEWVLETTRERSVYRAAESLEIQVPRLDDPRMIRSGLVRYHALCATCHGAPGVKISATGQGLNPYPPELAGEAGEDPLELFWVVKNGIKMTGMPAYGVTLSDEEIWEVVAFLKRMPQLSPEEYRALARQAGEAQP